MKPRFSINEAFRFGWEAFKKNFWFLTAILLVLFVISSISNYALRISEHAPFLGGLINLVAVIFGIIVQMGIIKITLKFVDKGKPVFDDLFSEYKLFWRYLGASIIYGLIVLGGLILLIVPGIIWALKFQFYRYLIIDKKMGIKESLKKSGEMTEGAKWDLLLFWILVIGVNILGALAFGVGLIIAVPVTILASVFVYRELFKHAHSAHPAAA